MKKHLRSLIALTLSGISILAAQRVDDTRLKQVILFGRHGVRAPLLPDSTLNHFSAQPFPVFGVAGGNLTANGKTNETNLGSYFRLWLTKENLLTGDDVADAAFVYCRTSTAALHMDTAKAFWAGMLPAAGATIDTSTGVDPLFDPLDAGVARLDQRMAIAAIQGRLGDNPQALAAAYAPELALTRSVLFGYPASQTPAPGTPVDKLDATAIPIELTAGQPGLPVGLGGLTTVNGAIDPFLMEYADGLPLSEVGWGQLTVDGISQTSRLTTLLLDLAFRTPYLARVQSSNLASHVTRSLVQSAAGNAMAGALGNPSSKVIVLIASNTNITGLAGLLHLDWTVPGYPADTCAPDGILSFELRQSQSTGEYIVRVSYVTQTMDQLRNRTPLTLTAPPAIAPIFVPGCSKRNATFDCSLDDFVTVSRHAIDPLSVDLTN